LSEKKKVCEYVFYSKKKKKENDQITHMSQK